MSRVATTDPSVEVDDGNGTILIQIEPRGLLQENMYVLGTIHLEFNGEHWVIDVELKATSNDRPAFIGNQSLVFTVFFLLFAGWFASSLFGKKRVVHVNQFDYSEDEFLPGNHL